MLNSIISTIKNLWVHSSSSRYITYLKRKGISIGDNVIFYAPRTCLIDETRPSLVTIGNNVIFNKGFSLLTHDYVSGVFIHCGKQFLPSSGRVSIGNNVGFGYNVTVLKGVSIGDNVFIGAGSIVTKDIPSNSVAAGNPCKVICSIDDYYCRRKRDCISESLEYARSIYQRFNRTPVPSDFAEEFPMFVSGDEIELYSELPIKRQLGPMFESYKSYKAPFKSFNEFIEKAKKN